MIVITVVELNNNADYTSNGSYIGTYNNHISLVVIANKKPTMNNNKKNQSTKEGNKCESNPRTYEELRNSKPFYVTAQPLNFMIYSERSF